MQQPPINFTPHVTQIQYLAWPDHGVPEDYDDFIQMVTLLRKKRNQVDNQSNQQQKVCVHCSAGIGRTGVLISVETAMNQIEQGLKLDPKNVLIQMRLQRAQMVQKQQQYVFSIKALLKWYEDFCNR